MNWRCMSDYFHFLPQMCKKRQRIIFEVLLALKITINSGRMWSDNSPLFPS